MKLFYSFIISFLLSQSCVASELATPSAQELSLLEPLPYINEPTEYVGRLIYYDAIGRWVSWDFESGTVFDLSATADNDPNLNVITGGACGSSGPFCLGIQGAGRVRKLENGQWLDHAQVGIFHPDFLLEELTLQSTHDLYIFPYSNDPNSYSVRIGYGISSITAMQKIISKKNVELLFDQTEVIDLMLPAISALASALPFPVQTTRNDWNVIYGSDAHKSFNFGNVLLDDTFAMDLNLANDGDNGLPVRAIEDGIIKAVIESYGYVLIEHTSRLKTRKNNESFVWYSGYMHMDNIDLKKHSVGKKVSAKEVIGKISNTVGVGTLPNHLHYAIYRLNPITNRYESIDIQNILPQAHMRRLKDIHYACFSKKADCTKQAPWWNTSIKPCSYPRQEVCGS